MTQDQYEKVKQAADHLRDLKRFEAFLSSHINLKLYGDKKTTIEHANEQASVPDVVVADWLANVRALLTIAQDRFNKIEINNIND